MVNGTLKNRRSIFLLNVDTKILPKAISDEIKGVLQRLISSQQTAYTKKTDLLENFCHN